MTNHLQENKDKIEETLKEVSEITEEEIENLPLEETDDEPVVEEETKEVEPEVEPSKEIKEKLKEEVKEKEKKLSASARENQKIYAKNRVLNKAIVEADEIPEPTEDELQVSYKDWDVMSEFERETAKENMWNKRWRDKIREASDQAKKIEKWNDEVSNFATDPQTLADNPELEGKTEDFIEYATQETNNSVPFKILVNSFLHEQGKMKSKYTGAMFETGSGGSNEKPQPRNDKLSLEEARLLRQSDYNKYKEFLRAGKIELDV